MTIDPPPQATSANPVAALQQNPQLRVAYWILMLGFAITLTTLWFANGVGPGHPVTSVLVTVWAFLLTPGVAVPALRIIPPGWYHVPTGERLLHRMLGVSAFARVLEGSGWNRRNVYPMWGCLINRSRLGVRAQAARGGTAAHGACFAVHGFLALIAFLTGFPWGALGILLPGVVLHLYPVLLQRAVMLRIQPLLDGRSR